MKKKKGESKSWRHERVLKSCILILVVFVICQFVNCVGDCPDACASSCDKVCETCPLTHLCPSWLQGVWRGTSVLDGSLFNMNVSGTRAIVFSQKYEVTWSIYLYCGPMLGNIADGLDRRRLTELDKLYTNPAYFRETTSKGITRLRYVGREHSTMSLDVVIPAWIVTTSSTNCDAERYPTENDEYTIAWPSSAYNSFTRVYYTCATEVLTQRCPHWIDGHWLGANTRAQGKWKHAFPFANADPNWNMSIF